MITDKMVEAACSAYEGEKNWAAIAESSFAEPMRKDMRAALQAAQSASPQRQGALAFALMQGGELLSVHPSQAEAEDDAETYAPKCTITVEPLFAAAPPPSADDAPAGWKLVPIEPNWDMRNEGREFLIDEIEKEPERLAYFLWKTMLSAAPDAPRSGDAPVAAEPFGWAVLDKHGCAERVVTRMRYEYGVSEPVIRAGVAHDLLPYLDREYAGLAPHRIVPLYTAAPSALPPSLRQFPNRGSG